jgi:large subunit ribosomal protein L6
MSRIGKLPVPIPSGVSVSFDNKVISVVGPNGKLTQEYNGLISFETKGSEVIVSRANEAKQTRAFHGLYRNLLKNMVLGVSAGFKKNLVLTGVGYRAEVRGQILMMNLGYSSEIFVGIPEGLKVVSDTGGRIEISGIDKQSVGKFASEVRKLRGPEPYKGKGIRYEDEHIRRKVGKSGVK